MQPLAFTTDKMSWSFILSALNRIQADEARESSVSLNLEAPSCIVLSCIAIEAFVNEVASLTNSFLFEQKRERPARDPACAQVGQKPALRELEEVASIRTDSRGSFYDRYKRLLCDMDIEKPGCLADLSSLGKVRDALVHFRQCDVPIVENGDGVIREGQDLPSELAQLQSRKYQGQHIVAPDQGSAWTLRLATDAMAAWSLNLCLDAIKHVLDHLPTGKHRDFVWKAYACRDSAFDTVFASGKETLAAWWNMITNGEEP
jgi:hypothetical protein